MITVAALVYRSVEWLDFLEEGLRSACNLHAYRKLIVGNDIHPELDGRCDYYHTNVDPNEHYLTRVYRAWNKAVEIAETEWVCLVNSDMYPSDGWLDELVNIAEKHPRTLPTSLLVESGRLPSAMPEWVCNMGLTPDSFQKEEWRTLANSLRTPGKLSNGRLYMPVLFRRDHFLELGGYPLGNVNGVPGDQILFAKFKDCGYRHVTCHGSVVYHVQEGEMRSDP